MADTRTYLTCRPCRLDPKREPYRAPHTADGAGLDAMNRHWTKEHKR